MNTRRLDGTRIAMRNLNRRLRALWTDEDGMTGLEYALLLMLMALSALVAWRSMGDVVASSVEEDTGQAETATAMTCAGTGIVPRPGQ